MSIIMFEPPTVVQSLIDDMDELDAYVALHTTTPVNFITFGSVKNPSFSAVYKTRLYPLQDFKQYIMSDDKIDKLLESVLSKVRSLLLSYEPKDLIKQLRRTGITLTPSQLLYPHIKHDLIYESYSISF